MYIVDLKIGDNVYPKTKLPTTAKIIAQAASIKLRSGILSAEESRSLRRLITVSINGGVAVDLPDRSLQLQLGHGDVYRINAYFISIGC